MANATRKRKSSEERRAQVASLRDRLAEFEAMTDAGLIAEYLARFDGYSARNAMLIAMQCPNATEVRGFRAWLDAGRCVRMGETSIQILAPCSPRKDGDGEDTGEDTGPRDGEQTLVKPRMRFRLAHVFDVAQTDALEVPGSVAS